MMQKPVFIVGLVVTYRRPEIVLRLTERLNHQTRVLDHLLLINNAAEAETEAAARTFHGKLTYVGLEENLGAARALAQGQEQALREFTEMTHLAILDDDIVPPDETLERLLAASQSIPSDHVVPLLTDGQGSLWGIPEPVKPALRKSLRNCISRPNRVEEDACSRPEAFCWATGACAVVTRRALEVCGVYRPEFFITGDDLEFSMRTASRLGGHFLPDLRVPHLPPEPAAGQCPDPAAGMMKFCALLQNLVYLAFRSPHSRHLWRYVPGNVKRFVKTYGIGPFPLSLLIRVLWGALACGQPAGLAQGERIRDQIRQRYRNQ